MQDIARVVHSQTGIGRKIGGIPELTTDTLTIANRRGNSTDLKVKVLRIIGGSIVDAEMVNLVTDSIIKAVDRVVRGTVLSGSEWPKQVFKLLSDRVESGYDRLQSTEIPSDTEHRTIGISSLRMTPVELPYVPILLNEAFIIALWDTGAEKSFISQEVYRRYFSYRPRHKTMDRVVTAQGAPCCHLGRVELQIRIRDFQRTWEFHILNSMQFQCILGIDFMNESILTLDFDKKSLIIPDDQIKQLPIVEKPVEIDVSVTKLGEGQKQKLKELFNSFKGLFSDQPGLTHVLYHEIDTGDQGPEGTILPIQSPYVSPVVLTRKNNGLPPDSPEAYRFTIDYRKLNAITKYPRYPLPVIDDLITNIPHTTIMSTLDLLSEAPVLQLPNFQEQFNLFTDASGVRIGAVLNENHKPIAFASRTLNKAERNYTVTERECLVVIWALNKFRTYFGTLPVKVITNHTALTKLTNGKNLSSRMIRWALELSEFNIEWEHRPGVQNVVVDVLSRNPVDNVDESQISCVTLRALALNYRE
ncbi:retrovirus-related Pol polyprotein from transposon opus [Trichonephila clavipes]|nr:retrovirus-related Pol polyprotein from transposon opus [Trichonephila clavipes]